MTVINKHRPENNPNPRRRDLKGTLRCQGRWVAIAIDPEPTHEGLIIVPDNAKNAVKSSWGEIVSMGAEVWEKFTGVNIDLDIGSRVMFDWYKTPGGVALDDGIPFLINGRQVRFCDVDALMAVED